MRLYCTGEKHLLGGPGTFLLSRAEDALPALIADYANTVQLIYLDPPFGTGDVFYMKAPGGKGTVRVPVYSDKMNEADYLSMMRTVLSGCRALLSDAGSLYLHIDYRMSAKLRLLMDELFGPENFLNEIIWCYKSGGRSTNYFPRKHDTILFYRKGPGVYFDIAAVGMPRGTEKRNHMKRSVAEDGRVCFSIRSGGKTYTYYEDTPLYPTDVWNDIEHLQQKDRERMGYATQKPEALLNRIIRASSRPGDLVMDLFSGSGTTAAAAEKLGRRYFALDSSPISLYTLRMRQLLSGGAPTLLSGPKEMRLSYAADDAPATISCTREQLGGRCVVTLLSAAFSENVPLVYAALGTVECDIFSPRTLTCTPKLPLRFDTPPLDAPVLQIVDALGRQAFFTVE